MIDTNRLNELLDKTDIIWLMDRKQTDRNSATELGRELLRKSSFQVYYTPKYPFQWISLFWKIYSGKSSIYYQISKPTTNIFVALLVLFRKTVIVHYLDNIVGGYPKWALYMQFDKIIYFLLKRSSYTVFISKTMLRFFRITLKPKGVLSVYYRVTPDDGQVALDNHPMYNKCLVYLGAINPKTNLAAIKQAAKKLYEYDFNLHIYTRSKKEALLSLIDSPNITFFSEIPPEDVISTASRYEGILFPFNLDKHSQKFYRMSVPSKLPNMISARKPIVYFGPQNFWLNSWGKKFPCCFVSLDAFISNQNYSKELIDIDLSQGFFHNFKEKDY